MVKQRIQTKKKALKRRTSSKLRRTVVRHEESEPCDDEAPPPDINGVLDEDLEERTYGIQIMEVKYGRDYEVNSFEYESINSRLEKNDITDWLENDTPDGRLEDMNTLDYELDVIYVERDEYRHLTKRLSRGKIY